MSEILERLRAGAGQLWDVLPPLIAAAAILLAGYFLARQVQRWVDDTLQAARFRSRGHAGGLDEAVVRTGSRLDPIRALAKLMFWLVMLVVILLASAALGLESINQMFGTMLSFIPTLIAGDRDRDPRHDRGRVRARACIVAPAGRWRVCRPWPSWPRARWCSSRSSWRCSRSGVAEEIVTSAFTLDPGRRRARRAGWRSGWATGSWPARSRGAGTRRDSDATGGRQIEARRAAGRAPTAGLKPQ